MNKKDIRALVVIWIVGTLMAFLTAALVYAAYPGGSLPEGSAPTAETATTSWISAPASPVADSVRVNFAWTIAVIFPFLYAPIMTLIYCIFRFSREKNPNADQFHEHVPLEVAWTILPALILVAMAVPAYQVLVLMEKRPTNPDVVLDITGHQFFWSYNFPKYDVSVTDDGTGRSPVLLPVDKDVLLKGTASQVNHAWFVPAFGVKFDVLPGRTTTSWVRPNSQGLFKGQCAELCGALHAYMWIHVKVVPEKEFYAWLKEKGATFPPDEAARISQLLGEEVEVTAAPAPGDTLALAAK